MWRKLALSVCLGAVCAMPAVGQVDPDERDEGMSVSPRATFAGDRYRIGIGIDSEFDVIGEFQASLHESASSAWIGEGWLGRKRAGGLKLNFHTVLGGATEEGLEGPVYTDGHVAKFFLAGDQNQHDDRKLTFGGGYERNDLFFSLYGMRAISDERLVNRVFDIEEILVEGQQGGHDFTRMDTLERITEFFEAPYEWGAGGRIGKYFDQPLLRLRAGFDFEDGKAGASQSTISASIDKFFANTGHSLSLRGGYVRKRGDFELDKNDWRGSLVYSYSFGQVYRPRREYREEEVAVTPPAEPRYEERVQATEVTLSDETTFDFDSSALKPAAEATLRELVDAIERGGLISGIRVVGHTCDIGPAEYNQGLSERRARSVVDFLAAAGIDAEIHWEGQGESSPRYPNDSEENRRQNRRVEITFVTEEQRTERVAVGPDEPVTEIRQVEVPAEAPWIRRALRNPVRHKREVDVYRREEVSETLTEGETVFENQGPAANDDAFTVDQDSADNTLDVLANDSDPDGDGLTIVDVSQPANGQAEISGGAVLYSPAPGFFGSETFSYTVEDGFGGQASAQVTVQVVAPGQPPVAEDFTVTTPRGAPVDIDLLSHAHDPDGEALEVAEYSQPANGTLEDRGGGTVEYAPDTQFVGSDSMTYTVRDEGGREATATVTIEVTAGNRPPVANPDSATTPGGVPVEVEVLANDFDPDGDPIEVIDVIQVAGAAGTAEINEDGTITFTISGTCSGFNLFRYTITDPFGETATANVTVRRDDSGGDGTQDDGGIECGPF